LHAFHALTRRLSCAQRAQAALMSQKESGDPIQPLPPSNGTAAGQITRFIVCGNLFEARRSHSVCAGPTVFRQC
jgi:hypothetical protein